MSASKLNYPAMEVIQGEMYIFGEKLPRHPEFPWLFSATALHKSCEEAIKLRAEQNGKDPEKFYRAKRPGEWIKRNLLDNEERIEHYAKHTRTRIKKYGPNLGFGLKKDTATYVALDDLDDIEIVCVTVNGGPLRGSYLCQLAIVKYIETFSEKFKATVQNSFISMVNGEVETVIEEVEENARKARGTKELEQCREAGVELARVCAEKGIRNTLKVQEGINHGVLGMPGEKYRKANGLPKPLNDNLTVSQIQQKMHANVFAVEIISADSRSAIPAKEAKPIGLRAGSLASVLSEDSEIKRLLSERATTRVKLLEAQEAERKANSALKKVSLGKPSLNQVRS